MNFALILFVLCVLTGILWVMDKAVFAKQRPAGSPDPWWVEYGASFFPVIIVVFTLRSFVVEPFRIPSGSMIPTLLVGDFILVNKYTYGVRLPVLNTKIVNMNDPQRGDVMVFRYPADPSVNYIKRVVGLPGDKIAYQNKRLTINGVEVPVKAQEDYFHKERAYYSNRYSETLGEVEHSILNDRDARADVPMALDFPGRENCVYNHEGVRCEVPAGHYFVLGDNRDQSADSRVWGFVPDANIVGKAFFVWFHADAIVPPKGIDFGRIGSFR
ncbi:signal peptidase I [Methyloversatilis sp.]|uniref:signal peptidase I n=2 Tax=Methyloversatilis TaxID=378210 RepID=UPI003D281924